jgi:hypothetical protein
MIKEKLLRKKSWLTIVIIISVLAAGIYMIFTASGKNLPSYVDTPTPLPEATPTAVIDTDRYYNGNYDISVEVPLGWTYVLQDGYDTYINIDGAMIQIQIMDYIPSLNAISADIIANDAAAVGGVLIEFDRIATDAYVSEYELGGVGYMEYTMWDLNTSVRVQFAASLDKYYAKYRETALYCLSTFTWNKQRPIPQGFILYYNTFGNFEFGLPLDWTGAITEDGVYTASNTQTGAVMYVSVTDSPETFEGISQISYVNAMNKYRQGFALRTFANDGSRLMAEATYTVGDIQYGFIQYQVCTGFYQYSFSFECQMDKIDDDLILYQTAVDLFRYF